jgi:hypothetical protein
MKPGVEGAVSLGRTIMRTIFLCCGAVLVITTMAFFAYDLYSFRQQSIQQLRTLGEAIASNSTAALAFENTQDAEIVLLTSKCLASSISFDILSYRELTNSNSLVLFATKSVLS